MQYAKADFIHWIFLLSLAGQVFSIDRQLVVYWGQDTAFRNSDRQTSEERDLVDLCVADSPFDIINIGFVHKYFDELNSDRLPGTNFDRHCYTPVDNSHKGLYKCPVIERGIRTCQQNGKKIVIAIGGPDGQQSFQSESQGEQFAVNIWDLFLGGHEEPDIRPFGSAICDGVNLMINKGSSAGLASFARHLYYLAKRDRTRRYIITASPTCDYPDPVLGPGIGKPLENAVKYFNHLYVRFYGSKCGRQSSSEYNRALESWLGFSKTMQRKHGISPLIFIGVPAMDEASSVSGCYRSTVQMRAIYGRLYNDQYFGGFMIWDASWDQLNFHYEKRYSERLAFVVNQYEERLHEEQAAAEAQQYPEEEEDPYVPTTVPVTTKPVIVYPSTQPPTWPVTATTKPPPNTPPPTPVADSDENSYPDVDEQTEEDEETDAEDEEQPLAQPEAENPPDDPYQPRKPDMENRLPDKSDDSKIVDDTEDDPEENPEEDPEEDQETDDDTEEDPKIIDDTEEDPEPVDDSDDEPELEPEHQPQPVDDSRYVRIEDDDVGPVAHLAEVEAHKDEKEAQINRKPKNKHQNTIDNNESYPNEQSVSQYPENLSQSYPANTEVGNPAKTEVGNPANTEQVNPGNIGYGYPGNIGHTYPAMPSGYNVKNEYFIDEKLAKFSKRVQQEAEMNGESNNMHQNTILNSDTHGYNHQGYPNQQSVSQYPESFGKSYPANREEINPGNIGGGYSGNIGHNYHAKPFGYNVNNEYFIDKKLAKFSKRVEQQAEMNRESNNMHQSTILNSDQLVSQYPEEGYSGNPEEVYSGNPEEGYSGNTEEGYSGSIEYPENINQAYPANTAEGFPGNIEDEYPKNIGGNYHAIPFGNNFNNKYFIDKKLAKFSKRHSKIKSDKEPDRFSGFGSGSASGDDL